MDEESKINKLILKSAYATIIVLIIAVIALIMLKYNVEGEKNMPFKLSSMLILSNAEGYQENSDTEYRWDTKIYQNNDIYLNIEKNKNYKETELIKSISIENLNIDKKPLIGEIKFYRVASEDKTVFTYKEEFEIKDKIEYEGDLESKLSDLKISNQGGTLIIRIVNNTGKEYKSNEKEIEHSGKLLNVVGLTNEEINSKISFDLVIKLESGISFRAKVSVDIPIGDITKEGYASTEIKDTKNVVFKREQI